MLRLNSLTNSTCKLQEIFSFNSLYFLCLLSVPDTTGPFPTLLTFPESHYGLRFLSTSDLSVFLYLSNFPDVIEPIPELVPAGILESSSDGASNAVSVMCFRYPKICIDLSSSFTVSREIE